MSDTLSKLDLHSFKETFKDSKKSSISLWTQIRQFKTSFVKYLQYVYWFQKSYY